MATADREYSIDTFVGNLQYLQSQGRTTATLPEITGHDHAMPASGHPLIDLAALTSRLINSPPVTIPLSDDVSLSVQEKPGGFFVSVQGRF